MRLGRFAVAITVQPHFRHDHRPVPRDVVQTGEVSVQAYLRFKVNIEAGEIEEGQLQVFGGRIIDVGHQSVGVLRFDGKVKPYEEAFQFAPAVPANDGSGDFVA